jgi:hypothetical protein
MRADGVFNLLLGFRVELAEAARVRGVICASQ